LRGQRRYQPAPVQQRGDQIPACAIRAHSASGQTGGGRR
jgi:hypothetical protein